MIEQPKTFSNITFQQFFMLTSDEKEEKLDWKSHTKQNIYKPKGLIQGKWWS